MDEGGARCEDTDAMKLLGLLLFALAVTTATRFLALPEALAAAGGRMPRF